MNAHLKDLWTRYYRHTIRIIAFVAAAVVMIWSFPDNNKFRYTYELNRPWRYDDVIAPFDFPIYKTADELRLERDSILQKSRPYYRREEISAVDVRAEVDKMLTQYRSKFTLICPPTVSRDSVQNYLSDRLVEALCEIYTQGVVELPEDVDESNYKDYELMLISGNMAEPYMLSELYTFREAYTRVVYLLRHAVARQYGNQTAWPFTLVDRMPIAEMLTPSVVFDKALTQTIQTEAIENISTTQGKLMAGQKIVSTGDIVDLQTCKVLDSLQRIYDPQMGVSQIVPIYIGESILVLCLLTSVYLFLLCFRPDVFRQLRCINFILLLMTFFVVVTSLLASRHTTYIPYVILPIVLRIFLDSRLALYVHIVTMFIISFMADNSHLFLLLHVPAGMIAIVSLVNLTRRVQIVRTGLIVFLTYAFVYSGYVLWQTGDVESIALSHIFRIGIGCVLIFLCYPLIYVFERLFGFISDVTLMELSDTNMTLLRELSEKAPGTFQHSVQVANLAQAVAYKLGANTMLVRAGAMYHDVGKINSPMFFTENQAAGINPHDTLDDKESARIVINHVHSGVKLAQKNGIPQPIIDIIRSHHGDSQARYFYVNYCNKHEGEEVDIQDFTYSGPTPQTKEEAIVMMADAIEASSKSLSDYTDQTIDALVEKIITMQMDNKQFRSAPITFRDVEDAKEVFKEKLRNIYKARVKYPEMHRN